MLWKTSQPSLCTNQTILGIFQIRALSSSCCHIILSPSLPPHTFEQHRRQSHGEFRGSMAPTQGNATEQLWRLLSECGKVMARMTSRGLLPQLSPDLVNVSRAKTNHYFQSQGREAATPNRLTSKPLIFSPVSTLSYTKTSGRSSGFSSPLPSIKCFICEVGV